MPGGRIRDASGRELLLRAEGDERVDVAAGSGLLVLDLFEPLGPGDALQRLRRRAIAGRSRADPGIFVRDEAARKHEPSSDIDGRKGAPGGIVEQFVIRGVEGGGCDSLRIGFNLDDLIDAHLFERSAIGFVEALELHSRKLGESETARELVAIDALVVRFDFLVIAEEGALGGCDVAVKVANCWCCAAVQSEAFAGSSNSISSRRF